LPVAGLQEREIAEMQHYTAGNEDNLPRAEYRLLIDYDPDRDRQVDCDRQDREQQISSGPPLIRLTK
jgi:hypothetical protein